MDPLKLLGARCRGNRRNRNGSCAAGGHRKQAHPTHELSQPGGLLRHSGGINDNTQDRAAILRCILDFRYLAIEGPIGVGKTALARHLGLRLDAAMVPDETDNPFVSDLYNGRAGAAFQAQLFSLLARHRQQSALRQTDLFSKLTISDYLFDKDKIYAYLNLDDNELFIYQRLYDLLAADVVTPDLVVYLQAPSDVLRRRARRRRRHGEEHPVPDDEYLGELNEAYNHFFYHYTATPLLVVETSQYDIDWGDAALDDLIRQLRDMGRGTRYYVPRTGRVSS